MQRLQVKKVDFETATPPGSHSPPPCPPPASAPSLALSFGFRVSVFGFRVSVWGVGFQVSGFGFRDSGFGFRVPGFRLQVWGFGIRVPGFRLQVWGSGFVQRPHGRFTNLFQKTLSSNAPGNLSAVTAQVPWSRRPPSPPERLKHVASEVSRSKAGSPVSPLSLSIAPPE